ncbi:MAG: MarR family winged helix-turn-helix transcriptional regulator [Symbiobacteriaceae bacterium]|nr:MarR family winged helix-turn-helix transcriptional regulator [Symbiobacteriaceae bacterium]
MLCQDCAPSDALVHDFLTVAHAFSMTLRPPHQLRPEAGPYPHRAFSLLGFLRKHAAQNGTPVSQSDIAADLRLAAPTVTLMLNDLEKDGFVERIRDSQDRRIVRVLLTPAGEQALTNQFRLHRERISYILSCLGENDVSSLMSNMQKVLDCVATSGDHLMYRKGATS